MRSILLLYRNAYGGLSRPAWMMSLVMLINRSGSMVTPFLGVYLTEQMGYGLKEAGIVMSVYGMGSVCGAFLGGWLTDKVGHFKVQFFSLTIGGSLYFTLLQLHTFHSIAIGVFILSLVNDCLRPANASSIASYARPENITRAFSLNRMAINLGFSVGPAVGGALAAVSYNWLFIADGATCIMAGLFFFIYFRNRQGSKPAKAADKAAPAEPTRSPYKDGYYLLFAALCCVFAILFFQLFSTLPLYYKQVYNLPEGRIGLLMGLNGAIVFLLEMIIVYKLGERARKAILISGGLFMLGLSFVLLNLMEHLAVLYIAMVLLSISEILAMPFMATITTERSGAANRGAYMGLYSIAYAVAHVFSPYLGTTIVANWGFATLWWVSGIVAVLAGIAFYFVVKHIEKVRLQQASVIAQLAAAEQQAQQGLTEVQGA
jgi:predicted MFS family arabinose efflux permease